MCMGNWECLEREREREREPRELFKMCVGAPREGALIKLSTISVGALKRGSVERAYKYVAKSVRGSKLLALTVRVKKYETAKLIFDAMNHF